MPFGGSQQERRQGQQKLFERLARGAPTLSGRVERWPARSVWARSAPVTGRGCFGQLSGPQQLSDCFEADAALGELDGRQAAVERAALVDTGDARVEHGLAERERGGRDRAVAGARALLGLQTLQVFDQVAAPLAATDTPDEAAAGVGVQRLWLHAQELGGGFGVQGRRRL